MTKKTTRARKRYRWTPETAPAKFEALSQERQRDFERALVKMRRGEISLRAAAKDFKIDRENLSAYVRAFGDVKARPGRALKVTKDRRPVSVKVITPDGEIVIDATGEEAYLSRQHRDALNTARKFRQRSKLVPWKQKFITDREGNAYELLSSLDRFFELFPPDEFNPASIYA